MENIRKLLSDINNKLNKLIVINENLKTENAIIKEENEILLQKIELKEIEVKQLKERINKLKIFKTFETGKDNKEAKNKINELVREIDRCISLLNE